MSESIMLSVAITVYNQKEYIKQAVDSVINQNIDFEYEVLIGDDGSTDGSYEYIQELYADNEHIKIYRMPRDNSVKEFSNWRHSRLILFLLGESRGKYISILDGDDFYCNNDGFKRKIEILEKKENNDCIACAGDLITLSILGGQYKTRGNRTQKISLSQKCFGINNNYTHIANCVIRREAFKNINYLLTDNFADQGILYHILHYGKLFYSPQYDFTYRQHVGTIWQGGNNAEHAIRAVLGFDIANHVYGDYYFRRLIKVRRDYVYINGHKKDIPTLVDWKMWRDHAKKYNLQIILALMDDKEVDVNIRKNVKRELAFLNFLYIVLIPADWITNKIIYIKESICWLADKNIPLTEKKKKIKAALKNN